jgi:hypothetical protein
VLAHLSRGHRGAGWIERDDEVEFCGDPLGRQDQDAAAVPPGTESAR